ncbi:serine/threonine protein kinase [Crinalium epipsammum PCC 9333]|uniref:non-specific serine/threonine protein kinase n=1 Tax=Crinalium epipsammum PCC 9333 TaxID=1173022 RepID=K9VYC8_9CYAN|nr:protein kinase [Crinalium epipsammum]AFZ13128.1 serine/threonine protein kinase [Crinalium epipsammum PCC 9333]
MSLITCSKGHQNPEGSRFCTLCGEPLPEHNAFAGGINTGLVEGTRLRDRYMIKYQLGQGGFGRTYLAEDTGRFNELIVLKELMPTGQGTYALQKAEELFQREAAILHKLRHPQIPKFWELFRDRKGLFLVQDYIEGKTYQDLLNNRLDNGQSFSEVEIIELLQQLLPVLSYLHKQGVIHRDISPDNVIRKEQDGLPILIDFGGVKQTAIDVATQLAAEKYGGSGTRLGKSGYAPDEQLRLGSVAPHSDLYALGVTAIVLMTGKPPQELFDAHTMSWVWNRQLNLSSDFNKILQRMLAQRPSERFQSAEEILQQLPAVSTVPETRVQPHLTQRQITSSNNNFIPPSPAPINTSGQGHLLDNSVEVPDEIVGWNWGAFLLPGFWCLTNRVWIGLLSWLDLSVVTLGIPTITISILLGLKGNEWAWKSRKWKSVKAFKRHQRFWAIAAFILWALFLIIIIGVILFAIAIAGFGM